MQMKDQLRGVFAPITTPFDANGDVDYQALIYNMKKYAESPLHGYLALGSNGENKSLSEDEKGKVLEIIISNKAPHQKVMTGCIAESTRETIHLAQQAVDAGTDFVTLLPPSYFKKQMTDAVLGKYFTDVASSVKKPCLLYCAPGFTGGTTLSTSLIKQMAEHENIVGIKDSSVGNMDSYLMAAPEDFAVMAGSANFFVSALTGGAVGGVISLGNVFPALTCELYELFVKKDYEACFALNNKVLRLNKTVSGKGGVSAVKAAMDMAGLKGGAPRLPLLPMSQADIDALEESLRSEGVI